MRLHEPYLRCLNPAWVSFTHVWGLVIPHALLFGPNSVGGGGQSRHVQDFGQIRDFHERLFLRVTDMMRQHGVNVGSDLTSLIAAAIKTSPHMLVGGA